MQEIQRQMSLALRGHCEHTVRDGDCHGGKFLALVTMQNAVRLGPA